MKCYYPNQNLTKRTQFTNHHRECHDPNTKALIAVTLRHGSGHIENIYNYKMYYFYSTHGLTNYGGTFENDHSHNSITFLYILNPMGIQEKGAWKCLTMLVFVCKGG